MSEHPDDIPVLQVHNLDFSYGPVQVLFDVGLEVRRGEVLALLGTNGAGKSTLLRAISGLGIPDRGVVRLNGRTLTYVDAEVRFRAGHRAAARRRGRVPRADGRREPARRRCSRPRSAAPERQARIERRARDVPRAREPPAGARPRSLGRPAADARPRDGARARARDPADRRAVARARAARRRGAARRRAGAQGSAARR